MESNKNRRKENWKEEKAYDAVSDAVLGYMDSGAKSVSALTALGGMPNASKYLYGLFDDRPQSVYGDIGAWLADNNRNTGLLTLGATQVARLNPMLMQWAMENPYPAFMVGAVGDGLITEGFEQGKAKAGGYDRTSGEQIKDAASSVINGGIDAARVKARKKLGVFEHAFDDAAADIVTNELPKFLYHENRDVLDGTESTFERWYKQKAIEELARGLE